MQTKTKNEFLELYKAYHQDLSNYCRSMVYHEDAAKDLMGESVMRALEAFEKLNDKQRFKSFLFGIASNVFKEQLRKMQSEQKHLDSLVAGVDELKGGEDAQLDKLLSLISVEQAEVFVLYEISDLSLKEIAEVLNENLSTVKTRLKRGRENLKAKLSKEFEQHINYF